MMPKALVTGGGGFLGKAIVTQLLDQGDDVRIFSRSRYPDVEALGVEVEWRAFNTGVEMAEAMVAGEIDISYSIGVVPFALAVTAGAPIKAVGVAVSYAANDNCVIYKKEAIDRANAHELEFVPNASGRRHDGLMVYTFGGVNVVVDTARESIRASIAGKWVPVSLEQLLEQAQKSKR